MATSSVIIIPLLFSVLTQAVPSPALSVFEGAENVMDTIPVEMLLNNVDLTYNDLGVLDSVAKSMQASETYKIPLDDTAPLQAISKQILNSFSSGCGRNPRVDRGGGDLGPWVVTIGNKINGLFSAHNNGILVSSQHVIMEAVRDDKLKMTHVQLGTGIRVPDPTAEERRIIRTSFPPELLKTDALIFFGFNIAILTLESPVQFDDFIQPACLPEPVTNETAYNIQHKEGASIYGFDLELLSRSPIIFIGEKYAINDIPYLGPAICKFVVERDPEVFNAKIADILTSWTLCAPTIHGEKVLSSTLLEKDAAGRMTLIGVGPLAPNGIDVPTIYSSVPQHLDWVNEVIKSKLSHGKNRG